VVEKELIAIIPARGGSKRIPHKNIAEFLGRPMIAWTIQAAQKSALFDRVFVSTDCEDTARVSQALGVEVPFLRDAHTDDCAPVSAATMRALEQLENHIGEQYRTVCQLMPNCPLRTERHIIDAWDHFDSSTAMFQISCFKFGWMNPWWAVKLDRDGYPERLFPEVSGKRSQDLQELYCPTGAIWLADVAALRQAGTFYGPGHQFYPIDWKAAVDIDDPDDLEMALAISKLTALG